MTSTLVSPQIKLFNNLMPRFLLLFLLGVAVVLAQAPTTPPASTTGLAATPSAWAEFAEAGAVSGSGITGGIGLAATISAGVSVFGELTATTGAGSSQTTNILVGVKTDLPKVKAITPFTIVAYGGALSSVLSLKSIPTGVTGLNTTSVTAFGTAAGFAQEYAGGGQYTFKSGLTLGIGELINKNTTSAWKGYPFMFFSKRF